MESFEAIFSEQYDTIHRLETNKLRNVARLFAHLLYTDSVPWSVRKHTAIKSTPVELNSDLTHMKLAVLSNWFSSCHCTSSLSLSVLCLLNVSRPGVGVYQNEWGDHNVVQQDLCEDPFPGALCLHGPTQTQPEAQRPVRTHTLKHVADVQK